MLPKIELKANLTELFTEFGSLPRKTTTKLYNILFYKHKAHIKRYEALQEAKTDFDVELIHKGEADLINGEVVPQNINIETFFPLIRESEFHQENENLYGNISQAVDQLKLIPETEISNEDVNPDWFARWRSDAKLIGDRDFQQIWGKVLAEEVRSPGAVSYRAMNVLRNLSKDEAQLFQELAPYIHSGAAIPYLPAFIQETISVDDILELQDAGLILQNKDLSERYSKHQNIDYNSETFMFAINLPNFIIFINNKTNPEPFTIGILELTQAGRTIAGLIKPSAFEHKQLDYILGVIKNDPRALYDNLELKVYLRIDDENISDEVYWSKSPS